MITPEEAKRARMQKAYADARAYFDKEKDDGPFKRMVKKGIRKYFADPVMDFFEPDKDSAREEYRARKEVIGYKCGGKMAKGGSVCRGGGAATRGIKFRGVK